MKNLIFILLLGLFVPLAQAYDFNKCCSVIPIMENEQIILNDESCVDYRASTGCPTGKQYKVTEMTECPKSVEKIDDTNYKIYRCSLAKK